MNDARPDWTQLNAYVDGELPPAEAAQVAKAVASDRNLAETAATLARLKAAVYDTAEEPDVEVPRAPVRRTPRRALAACFVGVLALAGAALFNPSAFTGSGAPPNWLDKAWTAHEDWAHDSRATARPQRANSDSADAGRVLNAIAQLGPQAYLPDLTAAKLTLSRIEPARLDGVDREAMHLGYRGTRGCRVSLFIFGDGAGLPRVFTEFGEWPRRSYAWRSATHGYLLMADGMDRARLDLIARTLLDASRAHAPLDTQARTALRASREASTPCPT